MLDTIKIVVVSDMHGELPDIPPCDLLLIAGDSCPVRGSHNPSIQYNWMNITMQSWLAVVPAKRVIMIGGNHDFVCESPMWTPSEEHFGAAYLQDSGMEVYDLNIWGTPWIPRLSDWAFYATDDRLKDIYGMIPTTTDILMLHSPPYKHLDAFPRGGELLEVGAPHIEQRIKEVKPLLAVCGHIHHSYGAKIIGDKDHPTLLVNAAHVDEGYNPVNAPVEITLKKNSYGITEITDCSVEIENINSPV